MDRLVQDVRHALRMLRKTPVFTYTVVLTLALGIGANTAMFSIVNGVLLRGLPFPDSSRLVALDEVERRSPTPGAIAPATFVDWGRMATSLERMAAYKRQTFNVAMPKGDPERLPGVLTSSTFFDVLGASPILGRGFIPADAEPGQGQSVVLSYGFWQRHFAGSPDALGQVLRLNDQPHTIVGVMPVTMNFPQDVEFWVPSAYDVPALFPGATGDPRERRDFHYLRAIGRIKDGQTLESVNAELATISDQLGRQYPDEASNFIGVARSLQDQLVGSARTPLLIFLGAVGCVLLIVAANVANLLMARATVRARELSIRAAVGADRRALVRQLLTESVLIALIGGGLGILVAFWGVDLILALEPGDVPRIAPIAVDGRALGFAAALSVVTGLLFGLAPAWQASRPELQLALKDNARGTTGDGHRHLARAALVLVEVSLSLVLLVGAGLLIRSMMTLLDVPLGFSTGRVLTMQMAPTGESYRTPGQLIGYWDRVVERARAVPGVESAALTTAVPMGGSISVVAFGIEGQPQVPLNQLPLTNYLDVSPGYFATLGIPVLRGREFEPLDAVESPTAIIINEAMARREFPDQDPIGRRFSFDSDAQGRPVWATIVGVVGNVRQYNAEEDPVPMTYGVYSGSAAQAQTLLARTSGDPRAVAGSLRAALQALDRSLPISAPQTLDEVIGASLTQRRFNMLLLVAFAGIALVLALAGIYGMVAYAVAQRTSEIGIRVALGATHGEILRLILGDALKPVAGGLVVGLAASFVFTKAIARLLYGVTATDPLTFATLTLLLAIVAFLASLLPALRAARVDPLEALRAE